MEVSIIGLIVLPWPLISLLKELLSEPLLECFVNIMLLLLVVDGVPLF